MNKVALVLTVVILGVMASKNSTSETNDNERQDNMFKEINDLVHDITNQIFFLLKLNRSFTSLEQNQLLLSMHVKMKNIANKNFEIYKYAIAETEKYDSELRNRTFKLDPPLQEIFDEGLANIKETRSSINKTTRVETNTTVVTNKTEKPEIIQLEKFVNTTECSIPVSENLVKFKNTTIVVNYKKWQPTHSTELDFSRTRRLFQPKHVKIKKFPFVASVYVKGFFTCTGSVISRDMIITAASCLQDATSLNETPDLVQVRIGSDFYDQEGELHNSIRYFTHPDYDAKTLNNNLAIIQMKKPFRVKKSNKKIRRIEYHRKDLKTPDELRKIVVLGWGDPNDQKANELSFSFLDTYNHADCQNIYTDKFVTEKNFCAGFITRGAGACMKDIGGPAVVSNVLVGVVSFGAPICGTVDAPTVFTDIGFYINWIDSTINRKSSGQKIKLILPTTSPSPTNLNIFHLSDHKLEDSLRLSSNSNKEYVPIITPAKKLGLSDDLLNIEIDFDDEDKFAVTNKEESLRQSIKEGLDKKQNFQNYPQEANSYNQKQGGYVKLDKKQIFQNFQQEANSYNQKPEGYVKVRFPEIQIRDTAPKAANSDEDIIFQPKTYQPKTSIKIDAAPLTLTTKLNQYNTSTTSLPPTDSSVLQLLFYLFNNLFQSGNIADIINKLNFKTKPIINYNIEPQRNKENTDASVVLQYLRNVQTKSTENIVVNSKKWDEYATVTTPSSQVETEDQAVPPSSAKEGEKDKINNLLKIFVEKFSVTPQDINRFNEKEEELLFSKKTTPQMEFSRTFSSPNLLTYLLDDSNNHKAGEQFLKKNFKKDPSHFVNKKKNSDEFVLLLLQDTSKPKDFNVMSRVQKNLRLGKRSTRISEIVTRQNKLKRLKGRLNIPPVRKKKHLIQLRANSFELVKSNESKSTHSHKNYLKLNKSDIYYNELLEKINGIKLRSQMAFNDSLTLPEYSDNDAVIVLFNESVFTNEKNLSKPPEHQKNKPFSLRNVINITFTVDNDSKKLASGRNEEESSSSEEEDSANENARRNIVQYLNL